MVLEEDGGTTGVGRATHAPAVGPTMPPAFNLQDFARGSSRGGLLLSPDTVLELVPDISWSSASLDLVEMNVVRTVPSGDDLAVCYNDWKMTLTGPDGTPTEARGKAIELCRRQRDGTWKYVLDDPWARG